MIGEELIPINASLLYRDPNNNHKPALLTTDYSLDLHLAALNFNPETIQVETFGHFPEQKVAFMLSSGNELSFFGFNS